ncbi:tol protein [Colletotrichum truncatum]|uniref:Tol protein n=1 Tax=Colletotrichum truncatum TaxID=5467 RepID=A0ACC3ZKS2_COLTU|nr:tol protein [Colletotrichum truncatum]KAF6800103.1 tol protein [Colletotrichum truncatum]
MEAPLLEMRIPGGSSSQSLCEDCKQLEFSAFKSLNETDRWKACYGDGIFVSTIRAHSHDRPTGGCKLCQVFAVSKIYGANGSESDGDDSYELRAFHYLRYSGMCRPAGKAGLDTLRESVTLVLVLVPKTLQGRQLHEALESHVSDNACAILQPGSPNTSIMFELPSCRFNPRVAQDWLQFCKLHHGPLCHAKTARASGLDLIDCETRLITTHRTTDTVHYIALSYVWGSSDSSDQETFRNDAEPRQLPLSLPRVISDAIVVTQSLGYRYLWVDKFCIRQDHPDKHKQIQHMDSVYENSDLTIVAAAGSDENYGIPGIKETERIIPSWIETVGANILWPVKNPQRMIRESKWGSRAWTFQESTLSRRRLLFLDDQVYFECNSMNCTESVRIPLETMHVKNKGNSRSNLRAGILSAYRNSQLFLDPNKTPLHISMIQYKSMVTQYTSRELRYDSDSLNAFEGILRMFRHRHESLSNLWGLCYPRSASNEMVKKLFTSSLAWYHIRPQRRRPEFPSWAWAGWAGKVQYPESSIESSQTYLSAISIDLHTAFGEQMVPIHRYQRKEQIEGHRALRIKGRFLPSNFFTHTYQEGGQAKWQFQGKPAPVFMSDSQYVGESSITKLKDMQQINFVLAGLHSVYGYSEDHDATALILQRNLQTGAWRRVGLWLISTKGCRNPLNIDDLERREYTME